MKRLLFEVHRWVGIVLALFMVLWFFSGLLIVYAPQSTQGRSQQLAHGETLAPQAGWLSLGEAWERSKAQRQSAAKGGGKGDGAIAEARLVRQAGEPFWLVDDNRGQRFRLSAIHGELSPAGAEAALKIASQWLGGGAGIPAVSHVESLDKPLILRNQDSLRPFHRIRVDDRAGSEILVSGRSGEVVHVSTWVDRALYWAGNWLHVFRFVDLLGYGDSRHDVLAWVSGFAVLAVVTGLVIGWLRWRPGWFGRATYGQGRTQPYRAFWFRWHFWSGLVGGIAILAWALSGFLNNNPGEIFSPANAGREEQALYRGKQVPAAMLEWKPVPLGADAHVPGVVELGWRRLGNEAVLLAYARDGQRLPQRVPSAALGFGEGALLAAVGRVAGDVPVASAGLQREYDSYYYARHGRSGLDRPLPVLRVDLADAAGTRYYLDPADGRLVLRQDQSRRVFRWLFSALHHWDVGWLYVRPLWDVWMLAWIAFGLALSATSLVIGWKRLGRSLSFGRGKASPAEASINQLTEKENPA